MQPTTPIQFERVAKQRLAAAEFLLQHGYNLDSMYLAGYGVECALKALILAWTPRGQRADMLAKITRGQSMHQAETLLEILFSQGRTLSRALKMQVVQSGWSTALRYETGRVPTSAVQKVLQAARDVLVLVKGYGA